MNSFISLFGVIIICLSIESHSQIIVNELMPVPNGSEPEWIEIFNTSDNDYSQDYLIICDMASCRALQNFYLERNSYCIITKDTTAFKSHRTISDNVRLYQFNIPTLNNTFDSLKVFNKDTVLLDGLFYDMKHGIKGVSFERVHPDLPATTPSNLKPSADISGATPGKRNSVFPVDYDISITSAAQNTDDYTISVLIESIGIKSINSVRLVLYADMNFDNIFDESEAIYDSQIDLNDNIAIVELDNSLNTQEIFSSIFNLQIEVIATNDDNPENNFSRFPAFMKGKTPKITINEIMFDTEAGYAEYLELYNHESKSVNLSGFGLYDRAELWSARYIINNLIIPPKEYYVIAYDSTIFENFAYLENMNNTFIPNNKLNLNNNDDLLVLAMPDKSILDSLTYFSTWHLKDDIDTKNRSLEKINIEMPSSEKMSWTTCLQPSGGTPGMQNSTYVELVRDGMLNVSPNPFSPNVTKEGSHCLISYSLIYEKAKITAKIYDLAANPVRTILSEHWTSNEGFFAWDGRDDSGLKLPVGPYILYFEAIESPSGEAYLDKVMIVIAE
ncbi:MAG: hypothetical protein CVV22_04515 [Ignavibacteriae bacterium HGW-Ignavibacteriae-1]|nr:MAG: hypothetical protein CVV22_04515 [Ignavibacteriae bacterium HGW-Ignavibacteriae-1]